MQHDEMLWSVINQQFCSFQTTLGTAKSDKTQFCRHPYSVTGKCNRTSCPLANSQYATIREENGRVNLYMKTVERAHSPKNLWEKVTLSRNYNKAIQQLEQHLQYFGAPVLLHRCKQRLTKIHQYLIRMRKLELKKRQGRKVSIYDRVHRKTDQMEERREEKALRAAKLEQTIQKELIQRLANGTYGDIYNFPQAPYQKALEQAEEAEMEEASEEEEGLVEYVEDLEDSEEEEGFVEDDEDMEDYLGDGQWGALPPSADKDDDDESSDYDVKPAAPDPKRPTKKKPRVEIEYEEEEDDEEIAIPEATQMAW